MAELKIEKVTEDSPLKAKVQRIYIKSFPLFERVSLEPFFNSVSDGVEIFALSDEEDVVAFFCTLRKDKYYYLFYLAVDEDKRGKGIGSDIRSLLHFSVPDKGPLADADTWMPDMMQLMADGVQQKKKLLLQKMQGLAGEMSGQMNANLTGAVAASVQTAGNAGMPDNSAAIITVLENGFRVLRRAIEDKETSVQLDGETVSRSVTQRQNRRELMRGKAVTP